MPTRRWLSGCLALHSSRITVLKRLGFLGLKLVGVELPVSVTFGAGLELAHGAVGLVVHESTVLGVDVKLYQGVTLGRSDTHSHHPKGGGGVVLEDCVVVGSGAIVLFRSGQRLRIGRGAVVGANSVLLESVPAGEVWAGNPARRVGAVSPSPRQGDPRPT